MSDERTYKTCSDCGEMLPGYVHHCPVKVDALESRVRELKAALAARTESLEAALASRAAMGSERATLRAECDRLRGLVREAVAGMAKIADHGKGFTDEQMHLRIYAATYYRWAKDEAADLVARLGAE